MQNGTLTYKSLNADDPNVVELQASDGNIVRMHGGHVSSMVESHGEDKVGALLEGKFPPDGLSAAAGGLAGVMAGTMMDPLISNPEIKKVMPVHPKTNQCAMM